MTESGGPGSGGDSGDEDRGQREGRAAQVEARVAQLEGRLRAEERKLAALRELHRTLGATLELDRLLVLLVDRCCQILDAERATLYLVSDDREELWSAITQGGDAPRIRLKMGEGIAGWVARSGATVNLPDAYGDPRFQKDIDTRTGFRTRSMLAMPMPGRTGRAIGVFQVLNKRVGPFDGDDEALLGAIASHAGIAIENSKLYATLVTKNNALVAAQADLKRRVEDLDLLLEIEREVSAASDVDDLLDRLLRRAMEIIPAEAGAVLLRDERTGEQYFRTTVGGSGEAARRYRLGEGRGIAGWAAQHREPLVVNDPARDPRHDLELALRIGYRPRNILAAPLVHVDSAQDKVESLGAIELLDRRGRAGFEPGDVKLLQLIAGHASRALMLARAKEEQAKQDRLAAIGQLLSGVVHDLRTPMTIISGYAQMMVSTEDTETRLISAEAIQKQCDLMAAMTREVMQFARGESTLLVRKVYLQKFVIGLREQLEHELAGRGVRLEIDCRYTGVAWFDELKLYRVVQNIARNAVEAMPEGGVFRIMVDAIDDELSFEFSDTGKGVPPELEGRLFQLFATSGKPGGTGLGLAIVKKIVDEHHGRVSYRSRPEGGALFHVVLPLGREAQLPSSQPAAQANASG